MAAFLKLNLAAEQELHEASRKAVFQQVPSSMARDILLNKSDYHENNLGPTGIPVGCKLSLNQMKDNFNEIQALALKQSNAFNLRQNAIQQHSLRNINPIALQRHCNIVRHPVQGLVISGSQGVLTHPEAFMRYNSIWNRNAMKVSDKSKHQKHRPSIKTSIGRKQVKRARRCYFYPRCKCFVTECKGMNANSCIHVNSGRIPRPREEELEKEKHELRKKEKRDRYVTLKMLEKSRKEGTVHD